MGSRIIDYLSITDTYRFLVGRYLNNQILQDEERRILYINILKIFDYESGSNFMFARQELFTGLCRSTIIQSFFIFAKDFDALYKFCEWG